MKKGRYIFLALCSTAWLASGVYIVRGNEQALVRRFGRAVRPLRDSGLYCDLPWPFARIDRVNVNAVQTLSIGLPLGELSPEARPIFAPSAARQGDFLTGDRNVLQLAINVQYRVVDPYLFCTQSEGPDTGLRVLIESLAADMVSRSGVDFVHPLGLNELHVQLSRAARAAAETYPWGVLVEDVTIAAALPPAEVKAAFLDVSNARAEKDRLINQEQSRAEQKLAAARAQANTTRDRAAASRIARVEAARGAADRFRTVTASFRAPPGTGDSPETIRRRTMQRLFSAAMEEILPRLRSKVLLDPAEPFDMTIFSREEAATPKP